MHPGPPGSAPVPLSALKRANYLREWGVCVRRGPCPFAQKFRMSCDNVVTPTSHAANHHRQQRIPRHKTSTAYCTPRVALSGVTAGGRSAGRAAMSFDACTAPDVAPAGIAQAMRDRDGISKLRSVAAGCRTCSNWAPPRRRLPCSTNCSTSGTTYVDLKTRRPLPPVRRPLQCGQDRPARRNV